MDPLGLKRLTKKFVSPSNFLQQGLISDMSSQDQVSEKQQQTLNKSNNSKQRSDNTSDQQILEESLLMTHSASSQSVTNIFKPPNSENSGSQITKRNLPNNHGVQLARKSPPQVLDLVYGRKSTPKDIHVSARIQSTEATETEAGISSVCQILAGQISAARTFTASTSQPSASQPSASQPSASQPSASQLSASQPSAAATSESSAVLASQTSDIICDQCGAKFGKPNKLKEHKIKHDGRACQYCAKIYHSYSSLRFHMDSKHSSKTFECLKCGDSFSGLTVLRRHEKTSACENQQNREKNSFCEICGKGYKTKKSMKAHLKKHEVDSDSD